MLDYDEVINTLNHYRDKALEEYQNLEKLRHEHLESIFKIEEKDPLLGVRYLSGGDSQLIEQALISFKNLSLANFKVVANKKAMLSVGKKIVERSTPEVKSLFSKLRNNDEDLYAFLSLLFKTEADILRVEHKRANERFNPNFHHLQNNNNTTTINSSFTQQQKKENEDLENITNDFLFNYCAYSKQDLENSKSQCSKTRKMTDFFLDYMKDNAINLTSKFITFLFLKDCSSLIKLIPKKNGNITEKYDYYKEYKKVKDSSDYEKRGRTTIKNDIHNFKRFIAYLEEKKYITLEEFKDLDRHILNEKNSLDRMVLSGEIEISKQRVAFKEDMLKLIFSENNPFYRYVFDIFEENKKLRTDMNIENYEARFYIPLLLFFSGARVEEMAQLKVSDFEIRRYDDNIERVLVYLEANEIRRLKTFTSRRIILLHDFFVHDLDFISFLRKCKNENREYLFNSENIGEKVGKEFNRDEIKEVCIMPFLNREDEFNKNHYSFYSFRHNYKTHMRIKGFPEDLVDKVQGHKVEKKSAGGYISYDTKEFVKVINGFTKHEEIDFSKFKEIAKIINKIN
jgi:integrase